MQLAEYGRKQLDLPRPPRIAWDSTCFTAWLDKKVSEPPEVLEALDITFERMARGEIRIVASQAIEIEVRSTDLAKSKEFHQQLRACPFFEGFSESPAIRKLAQDLQDRLQRSNRRGGYADLLHVATAIASRSEEFWTTDKKVINWYTHGVIDEIKICAPYLDQGVLAL